jgi:hypothetical protein
MGDDQGTEEKNGASAGRKNEWSSNRHRREKGIGKVPRHPRHIHQSCWRATILQQKGGIMKLRSDCCGAEERDTSSSSEPSYFEIFVSYILLRHM